MQDRGIKIVATRHKNEVDAATQLMDKALTAIVHREHRHAAGFLERAIRHLGAAEALQSILDEFSRK